MFSVRIVSTDHYMSAPLRGLDVQYADQRGLEVKKVPVVRVFGSTTAGQKTCMHIHGVFPYLYVLYDGTVPLDRYLRQFATSLDKAINVAQGYGQSSLQHVYKIVLVTGRSMYGFHDKEQHFLKIYFYNPSMIRKAADLLLGGAVLNKPFQPHESHIPYTLQLFIDYNLYGMNMINVAAVKFRRRSQSGDHDVLPYSQCSDEGFGAEPSTPTSFTALLNRSGSVTPSQRVWHKEDIPSDLYLDGSVERLSTCELEVDVVAADILNRLEVDANIGTNPGLSALWEDERQRRRDRGEASEITPPESQDRVDIDVADSEMILRERMRQIILDLQPYMDSQSDTESEQSQDVDFPLSQASDVDLHMSQDDIEGSPDTVMLEEDDVLKDKPIVNVESIQRVVSFSQSFSDARPDLPKVLSQDKSLVDILASLADDTSQQSSQDAAAEVSALEEQDSVLSQVSQPRDRERDKEEEDEVMEMSQQIWEGVDKKDDDGGYDMAGMDESWVDSQLEPSNKAADEGVTAADDCDSDATSDILPQYDGPPDEKGDAKRTEAKDALLKQLRMRGPTSNMPKGNPRSVAQFDSPGNMMATNPFADTHSTTHNFQAYHSSQVPQFPMSGSWNPAGNQNQSRGMPSQTLGGMCPSPGGVSNQPQHHSPGTFHQPRHSSLTGNQYSTNIKPTSPISSYQMPAGNRAIHNQYIARNQQFGQVQCSSQSQLSPGSYHGQQYLGSQGFDVRTSEHMSPPYIAQSVHHAQAHSSQSSVQYSVPVTYTQSQLSQRSSEHNRFMQADPGQYQHSTGSFAHSQKHKAFLMQKPGSREQGHSQLDSSESERANQTQAFHSTPYTRANQLAGTHAMSIANQRPELQSHDLTITRTNQLPIQAYAMSSDAISSPESDLHDPYQINCTDKADAPQVASPMPMYTAQPLSAITSSQTQNTYENYTVNATDPNNSGYLLKRPNPAVLSNRNVVNLLDIGNRKASLDRLKNVNTHPIFQHGCQQPETGTDAHRDVRKFLSNTLMQRRQKAGSVGKLGEFPSATDTSILRQDSFSYQTFHEGAGYTLENDSSPQTGQQLSPRTPAGDSGLQSPGSTSSKLSEPFVGPVSKFYQQKILVYEQISPPVTPVCANANDIKKPQSASSTSSGFSEPQISPLHRLLIDNSDFPMSRPDQRQRSPSRSSISSLSSIGSEKPINQAQQDVFQPALQNSTEKPRLFDMLINSKTECDSRKAASDSNENTSQSLNDSQQDLFADSLLSDIGSVENTTADSLTSLFSDDAPINPICHQGRATVGPLANSPLATPSKDVFATLSSLESFVGSVRNESAEFGVNFNKTSASDSLNVDVQQKNTPCGMQVSSIQQMTAAVRQMSGHEQMTMDRQLSGHQQTTMERLHQNETRVPHVFQQSHGRVPPVLQKSQSTMPPVIQQNQGKNCNLQNWPQYSSQTSALTKTGRGGGQRRRGRPPVKKCLSFPGDTSGVIEKKRKGRPKKKIEDFSNPPSFQQHGNIHTSSPGSQFSQQFRNCFPVPSNTEIPPNIDLSQNMNMSYYANQQSFSQLLEGDGSDLLTEFTNESNAMAGQGSQFGDNVSLLQGDQTSTNQFTTALDFHQNTTSADKQYPVNPGMIQEHFSPSLSNNQINLHSATDNFETRQPDRMSREHHGQQYPYQLYQEYFQQHTLPDQDQLSTINLSEAMQISEPTANFEPEFTNLCTEDVPHILPELENDQCCVTTQKVNIDQLHNMDDNRFITKSLKNMNMQRKQQQKEKLLSKIPDSSGDLASIMELMKYRQRSGSPPKSSAAYTFRFKVPTPIFKRLKFRIKRGAGESIGSQLDFVRMHPKDARKYSLLKIGREVIRLQNISGETIECIREKLKAGEDVEGIPPSIRLVEVANVLQTPSIIADLLSAEDSLNEDLIRTGNLEDILQGSLSLKMANFENNAAVMLKKERKLLLSKDKRINSMFKSRNLSNIPHLKKYRAGFPYFGKGHVGRGGSSVKVRPNNKGLKPEYEDDENIVIKDVCLNDASDGVLTPIKSRTPLAGRSPAHYGGGGNMPETENQEKTMIESKLKDIEYDLELKQSTNSQMFQDVFIGDKELQHKVDYDNVAQEQDVKDGLILDKDKVMDTDEETYHESVAVKVEQNVNTASSTNLEADGDETGKNEAFNEYLESKKMCEKCDTDVEEDVKMKVTVDDDHYKCIEKENCNSVEIKNMKITFGKFKKHLEKTLVLSKDDNENSTGENGCLASYDGMNIGARNIRSRSSSIDSQLIPSRSSSRQNSVILSGMSGDEDQSFLSSVGSVKRCQSSDGSDYNSDSKRVKQIKLGTYRSSSACSRKSSRSSSLDQDSSKKTCRSRKTKKKSNRHQFGDDSDGIPGVDYIVVNRFKGHKELRVVVEKLKLLHDSEVDLERLKCCEKMKNGFNSRLKSEHPSNNGVKYQKDDSNVKTETKQSKLSTGFSAEFEKFLASQTYPQVLDPDSDSDTEDCDFPDGMDYQNNSEKSQKRHELNSSNDKSKLVNNEDHGNRISGPEISEQSRRNIVSRSINNGESFQDDSTDLKNSNVANEAMLTDKVSVEAERSERASFPAGHEGEFSCSNNSSCSVVYKLDKHYTNVSSLTGLRDFSSSSEDEHSDKQRSIRPNMFQQKQCKSDGKKKKVSKSIHDGSVFCSKARKKRKKLMPRPSKLMCTLSVLHDATLEKLTSAPAFSDMETGTSSSSQSPAKSRDLSDIDSPIRWQVKVKTPDFEIYSDRTNDHLPVFEDTMYKLAYLSPLSSDGCCDSPPQPLSPKEMRKLDGPVEHSSDKIAEHNEKKMTLSDILKTMQVESELNKDMETNSCKIVETPDTPSKIAVAKTETLTFNDIKSFCLAEKDNEDKNLNNKRDEIEGNRTDSPPPDLGPPVLESETDVKLEDGSPPPQLSPNMTESECEFESSLIRETNLPKIGVNNNVPPFLTPCRSPRVALSPRYSSPRCLRAHDGTERGEYFSLPVERESGIGPGRSPGACSSSGSINVIHSEEFSDISDENDSDHDSGFRKHNRLGKPKYTNSPTMPSPSTKFGSDFKAYSGKKNSHLDEKERKLRDIHEFEERLRKADENTLRDKEEDLRNQERLKYEQESMRKADENRNNIFELMSSRNIAPISPSTDQNQSSVDLNLLHRNNLPSEIQNMAERLKQSVSGEFNDFKHIFKKSVYRNDQRRKLDLPLHSGPSTNYSQNTSVKFQNTALNGAVQKSQHKNGDYDFYNKTSEWNDELNSSVSQRNFRMKPYQNFNDSHGFQSMSLDLNRVALERNSSPNQKRLSPPQTNFFDNFSVSSQQSEKGINSGDLFESCSEGSRHRTLASFNRSLSENARSEYSIVRSNRLNNTIMRSVQNYANRDKAKQDFNNSTYNDIPLLEFGGGDGKRKHNVKKSDQIKRTTTQSQMSGSFHHREEDDLGGSHGNGGRDKGQSPETFDGSNITAGCHVITPHTGPPSLESILESANQHGLAAFRPTGAYYSNYGDVAEKPREGGGHVIKVASTLVKEFEEFESSSSSITGIKNWRTILCATDSLLSSQTGSSDLIEKLDTEPGLKYAITGDQSVIISPCIVPPCQKSVKKWNKARTVYKDLKNQAVKLESDKRELEVKSKENEKDKRISDKDDDDAVIDHEMYRLNLFTGKREIVRESEFTVVTEKTHTKDKSEHDKTVASISNQENKESKIDQEIQSPIVELKDFQRPSQEGDDECDLLHSTPLLRRGSTELFEPEFTPITGAKRALDTGDDQDQGFVTPKRIRPLRRLSTNTDNALRRVILSSQVKQQFGTPALQRRDTSQIEGPSLKNSFGFKHSQQNLQAAKALHEYQYLTVLSIELHVETRGDLRPDPEVDPMQAIFYSIFNDVHADEGTRHENGVFIVDPASANENKEDMSSTNEKTPGKNVSNAKAGSSRGTAAGSKSMSWKMEATLLQKSGIHGLKVTYVNDESELLQAFIDFVHRWDPDILVGYEIQMLSWGYILQRASTLNVNLAHAISRIPTAKSSSHHSKEKDEYGADHMSEIHIAGRIVLNLWRLLRHEVVLNVYSFENIAFHVLHRRIPLVPFRNLTTWFKHKTHLHRWKVVEHYVTRAKANLEIIEQLDIVGQTSEFARVFGIEFYNVLSRGTQYRVESMMLRVAKPMNYIPVSPSVHQRARMKAPECIQLTLEPESKFYTDPVVVVDFQSLYPSIMIAYNYCFSTCLGRVEWFKNAHEGPIEFGCTSLGMDPSVIKKLSDDVTISPNGVVFCKQTVKRGVLPIMLEEILKTRLMVKKAMSSCKDNKTLTRMLNARQMGLKLIANTTYGYTGANFSGRMPCVEVGDSIVRKARETLERSIKLVEDTPDWGARVVYGDTDSMFIELKGRSKDEAFKIGQKIAKAVSALFPKPIKLKFEKVYLPCVLQTKKRYVGFMYETPDQKEPVYDAKGIETVRRDACSAVSKVLERSIKILFTTRDVSQVKSYIQQQCQKVMEGSVSLQDFIFAKEYRGIPGYKPGSCVPALEIAKKQLRQDRQSEPRVGERVPYIIVYGSPGLPLIQLVRQPGELLQDPSLRLNATYYITKQILPPLDRFLSLIGVHVLSWYQEMPHSAGRVASHISGLEHAKKGTISQYFATSNCPTCDSQTKQPICPRCMKDPQLVCLTLNDRMTRWERVHHHIQQICGTCIGTSDTGTIKACVSLDCPIQYRRARAGTDMNKAQTYRDILAKVFK